MSLGLSPLGLVPLGLPPQTAAPPASATATLAWTESDDAASLSGVETDSGAEGWTEADDAHALTGVVSDVDAIAWTEADDAVAITGTVATQQPVNVSGSMSWAEQDDSFAAFMTSATGGAPGYGSGKRKRKYVVRKGDRLYAFTDPRAADAFLHADDELAPVKQYPAKKQGKQPPQPAPKTAPLPAPEQRIDLAEVRALAARQHAEAEYQRLMAQKHYEALLVLLERLQDEEEDDWLLMAAD